MLGEDLAMLGGVPLTLYDVIHDVTCPQKVLS